MVISPLGAPCIIPNDGVWKGDHKFIVMLYWQTVPIFNRQRVIRLFHFGLDFPIAGEILEVLGENDTQEVNIKKKLR